MENVESSKHNGTFSGEFKFIFKIEIGVFD